VVIEELKQKAIEDKNVELVERKGKGHPDYIADGTCEAVGRDLSKYYLKTFGTVLHHNVDKGLVVGGKANVTFGGGTVDEPIRIIVAGRATTAVADGKKMRSVPICNIALGAIHDFLDETFRFLNARTQVIAEYQVRAGSADLTRVFKTGKDMPRANDTSFGICFAPLSMVEKLTLETERYLNSEKVKKELPEVGEDIKVMGLRNGKSIDLTVAAAIISGLTPDLSHYLSVKEEIKNRVEDLATKITDYPVKVYVNTADNPKAGDPSSVYLTVTGTSAEHGDDGNTGRGNRVNGLITPCRPMSLEATAGKNPVSHVGKIYNVLAMIMSNKIYTEVPGIREVYVKILSQIGKPIDAPLMTSVELILEKGKTPSQVNSDIMGIVNDELDNIRRITNLIMDRKVMLF
jgi:S-adenosylmethionine synthetase